MSIIPGCLYIVATPIGNLDDLSHRAISVLKEVELILAEDTRHSHILLNRINVTTSMQSFHEHNEQKILPVIIERLDKNQSIALISDAGTPLISDPGFRLVHTAHERNIRVIPVPGPSALISALSVSGQATDRFVFEGYLPARKASRINRLKILEKESRSIVFFETPHRILACIEDMTNVFGEDRSITLAKELTKLHEAVVKMNIVDLKQWFLVDPVRQKGEFVLILEGAGSQEGSDLESIRVLEILLKSMSASKAAAVAAEITGKSKNYLYKRAISRSDND